VWWYVAKRLLQTIPVIIGATFIISLMTYLRQIGGDPVAGMFGDRPVSDAVRVQIEQQYHFDEPFIIQWLLFLKGAVVGDFGTAFSGQPVLDLVKRAFPVTVTLAVMALIFEMVLGIIVGTIAGLRRGRWFDQFSLVLSLALIAIPIFVVGFVLQWLFGVEWKIFPATVGGDWTIEKLIIPAIVLGTTSFAYIVRLTRGSVAESLVSDHVRTARAKGLSNGRVVRNHVLRNSLVPVVTFLGVDLGALMAGAVITEGIFNIPGVGNLAFRAIQQGQSPTVISVITIMVLVYVVTSLVVDLLYAALDPRIRYA